MKDCIVKNQPLLSQRDLLRPSIRTVENTQAIQGIQTVLIDHDDKLSDQSVHQLSGKDVRGRDWINGGIQG